MKYLVYALIFLATSAAAATDVAVNEQWPAYGGQPGGGHYSALEKITPKNVKQLKRAWVFHTGDMSTGTKKIARTTFEATPIFFNKLLYFCTPYNRVIALNPETGKQVWAYNPKINKLHLEKGSAEGDLICRGVASYIMPNNKVSELCHDRIITATQDARLISLDANTGKKCSGFGEQGEIDLAKGIVHKLSKKDLEKMQVPKAFYKKMPMLQTITYSATSTPVVIDNKIIVGSAIADNVYTKMPAGVVRAYDAVTGKRLWTFNPIPKNRRDKMGGANTWAPISVDVKNNLVFMGASSPSVDFYGGNRIQKVSYADSVIVLNATTGKPVWSFQTVHHDIFDYDIASQPTLATIRRNNKLQPAVIVGTKTGFIFAFNPKNGSPLFPIKERAVVQSNVLGEKAAKTQPFPVLPAPLIPDTLSEKNMWGLMLWDKQWCKNTFNKLRYAGLFTPPSLQGSLEFPMTGGGINWGGVAYNPKSNILVVNFSRVGHIIQLVSRQKANDPKAKEVSRMFGAPYGATRKLFVSPLGIPCNAPPWGKLVAIDMNTGKVRWQVPFGSVRKFFIRSLKRWGSPNMGGALTTASGLIFIGASMDKEFHAYNIWNGRELWHAALPAMGGATPMTFELNGKQYVVIAAGGVLKGPKNLIGDSLVAFTLSK